MKITPIKNIFLEPIDKQNYNLTAWIQNIRFSNKSIAFLELNDGSCFSYIQVIVKQSKTLNFNQITKASIGSSVLVSGHLVLTPDSYQPFEIQANEIALLKDCPPSDFPLQKKDISLEHLRTLLPVRHRTKLHRSIQLVRKEMAWAVHEFFRNLEFMLFHAPILTTNDCEGAGESFILEEKKDSNFFPTRTTLSVSGQLHAEAYALGFKKVYTFGPTFRSEKSNTNRHLSEFWMIEPEVSFSTINENIQLMEQFIKHMIDYALKNCLLELRYLQKMIESNEGLVDNLKTILKHPFKKIEYKQAIEDLILAKENGKKFEYDDIHFGMDLKSEHEKYLVDELYKCPTFVVNYPASLKAFYMKLNDDGITVAATDLLMPKIGEIIGGSEREHRIDIMKQRCKDLNIDLNQINWYLDLRKYGYYRSAGFGVGFERLIMFLTGVKNIKDTIPFPRSYQSIEH